MSNKTSSVAKQAQSRSVHTGFRSPLMVKTGSEQHCGHSPSPSPGQASQPHTQSSVADDNHQHQLGSDATNIDRIQREVTDLTEQLKEVEEKIQQLKNEGLDESELAEHINKLHEYNEIKDTAQMVLGHIATLQGVRTRDLYPKYGLELDD